MIQFPHAAKTEYSSIFLEETDKPLSKKLDVNLRYAYFKMIAKGGKSLIRSCKDLHLSRIVCYKTLLPEFANDEIEQRRFLREARVTAMLQHPNTIPIYELGRNNKGQCYFTMKLVHGYTLREVLDYRSRYDLTQLIDVVVQVAHALAYAHKHGVIHRDIKPENILVGPFGEVLLLDWGLAKVWSSDKSKQSLSSDLFSGEDEDGVEVESGVDRERDKQTNLTRSGKLQGTIHYMSPEQINKDSKIDARADIFSLGSVLYEVLTGEKSAQGKTVDEIVTNIRETEVLPLSAKSEGFIPNLLEEVTLQCLKKDPADRIQTMNEVIRLLLEDWSVDSLASN